MTPATPILVLQSAALNLHRQRNAPEGTADTHSQQALSPPPPLTHTHTPHPMPMTQKHDKVGVTPAPGAQLLEQCCRARGSRCRVLLAMMAVCRLLETSAAWATTKVRVWTLAEAEPVAHHQRGLTAIAAFHHPAAVVLDCPAFADGARATSVKTSQQQAARHACI